MGRGCTKKKRNLREYLEEFSSAYVSILFVILLRIWRAICLARRGTAAIDVCLRVASVPFVVGDEMR